MESRQHPLLHFLSLSPLGEVVGDGNAHDRICSLHGKASRAWVSELREQEDGSEREGELVSVCVCVCILYIVQWESSEHCLASFHNHRSLSVFFFFIHKSFIGRIITTVSTVLLQ